MSDDKEPGCLCAVIVIGMIIGMISLIGSCAYRQTTALSGFEVGKNALWEGKVVRIVRHEQYPLYDSPKTFTLFVNSNGKETRVLLPELTRIPDVIDESALKPGVDILYKGQVARILMVQYTIYTLRLKDGSEVSAQYGDLAPLSETIK